MFSASEVRNPYFGCCDEEGKRSDCHDDCQSCADQTDFRGENTQERKNADRHNQDAQSVRESVCIVFHMPLVFCLVELSFFQLILFIFGSTFRIEETHERAVGYKRNDAFRLIVIELQSSDPDENDQDRNADQVNTQLLSSPDGPDRRGECFGQRDFCRSDTGQ